MKINELRLILKKRNADAALFYNSDSSRTNPNMLYFSGYGGLGALVIPKKQPPFLIAPEMEFERAKKSIVKKVYSMEKKKFFESIYKIARKNRLKIKNIAIDKSSFTLNSYRHFRKQFKTHENQRRRESKILGFPKINDFRQFSGHRKSKGFSREIRTKDISFECLKLRETKTEKEMQILKKSCAYADKILQKAIKKFKSFRTESEASAFLEYEARKLGLELS